LTHAHSSPYRTRAATVSGEAAGVTNARMRTPINSLRRREALVGYLFILPAVIGFLLFTAGPILASLALSLTDFNIITPPTWIGLQNYRDLVADPLFWQSVTVTVKYAAFALPLGLVLALALAVLLNQKVRWVAFWRTIYYLPAVVSGAAIAVLWSWILNPEFGIVNLVLRAAGITGPNWLGDPRTALPSLVLVGLWGVGGSVVIYLAGLQGIPTDLYDAAKVDGANAWQRFTNVTLPMLSPVIFFNLVIGLIAAFQFFTEPFVMTDGGPQNSTLTYMLYLYRNAFDYLRMGYASALAWVFFVVVLLLTLAVFRSSPMWVHYEGQKAR
jgi:multiple sugar transport system permease protein